MLLDIVEGGVVVDQAIPSRRFYPARQMPTSEASIHTFGFSQLYIAMGETSADGTTTTVRIWWKPMITLIWLGTIFMVLAGAISLSDRRVRIGAAKKAKQRRLEPAGA